MSQEGGTPLLHAAKAGNREVVKVLLRHGADVELKNGDGETAMSAALNKGIDINSIRKELSL